MSFDPGWSFDNHTWVPQPSRTGGFQVPQTGPPQSLQTRPSQLFLTNTPPSHPGPLHPLQTRAPYPVQTQPLRPFLAGPPPIYQTGNSHLVPTGPLNHFQTFPPHPFQAGPHLFQPHPHPFQSQPPPLYQTVAQNVYLTEPFYPFRNWCTTRSSYFHPAPSSARHSRNNNPSHISFPTTQPITHHGVSRKQP